jgi:glycosyltransferase involved in cell wall biosynthesis
MDQVAELRARGHEVELVAPRLGGGRPGDASTESPRSFRSFRAVPRTGFSGIVAPTMTWWIARHVRRFDVMHVHLARDLTTTPSALTALAAGVPLVVQTHGMIDRSERRSAAVLDAIAIRRLLGRAAAVLCLTPHESAEVGDVAGRTSPVRVIVPNGVRLPEVAEDPPADGVVLFAARLAPRKRPDLFVAAARSLLAGGCDARFVVAGPDEGLGGEIRAAIAAAGRPDRLVYLGPLDRSGVAATLVGAAVLVLPSAEEPFPVAVLEALAAARPVIVTESCGLAPFVAEHRCGVVVPIDDVEALSSAITSIVGDRAGAAVMGRCGRAAVGEHLDVGAVVDRLERCYADAVAASTVDTVDRRRRSQS